MHPIRLLSAAAQVAEHLRGELQRGHWRESIPGAGALTAELGVNHKTVEAALRQLEQEGVLEGQGAGRKRRIVRSAAKSARPLRVAILLYEPTDRVLPYIVELQHALANAGHTTVIPAKSLHELGMDVARVARLVKQTETDAWIVLAGSHDVLEWFSQQSMPAFALFGRREGIPIAGTGPDKLTPITAATRQLIALGHRRIVTICRNERRKPNPGKTESAVLAVLAAHGIATSDYNLPDWEETRDGLNKLLNSLFRVTPPTALIVSEGLLLVATLQFLAAHKIRVPEDVSLFCGDSDPSYAWSVPTIAHSHWDFAPVIHRIIRWSSNVSRGREDKKQTTTPAEFIPGGTFGPCTK